MLPTAEGRIPALTSSEDIFSLAVPFVACSENRIGENAPEGKKTHQGIFPRNRTIASGATWAKWSGTHQDRSGSWPKTVLGIAIDANGNTLSDPSGKSYSWDFENRLVQVINPGVGTTSFKYDPWGRRIQKSGPLGTTNYLYDGSRLSEEVDNGGNVLARYTQSPGIDEPLSELRAGTTSYYQQDGIGSITSLSGSAGALANTYSYDSFGKLTASTGTITNPFQFAGREYDPETGTYDNRFRYYDQGAGRFVSEDPIGFMGGTNKYAYVFNNPTRFNDPFGLQGGCPEYPTDCVHNQSERDQIARENYEWHERIFGPPPAPGPPPPSSGCKCKNAETKDLTFERQLEAWSLAWRILDAAEEVGVGVSMIGGGVAGGAYVCVQTGFAGCVLAVEAAPGLVVGGYLVTRSAADDLEEIFIRDEDCQ
jgi:RHS repeat-associated protein